MSLTRIENHTIPATLDVRATAPRDRHPLIFGTFDRLAAGELFILVNDHDPKPLYYQFQAEQPGQVDWTYLEQGPDTWCARIGRVPDLAATPILELIATYPQLKDVLDDFELDTCCGGHFSVAEAAAHEDIDLQPVLEALRAALSTGL